MTSSNLHYLELVDVGRRIARREVSSLEVTQALIGRIARLDPQLKSYATRTPEAALAAARRADEELASGRHLGPLHGVPVAVKDLCDTASVATAGGMAIHRQRLPAKDATVVARLKAAGAVLLGKLQLTEGAFGAHHPAIDPPVNPWSAAHWTGVSSSGSGVATAAGLCFASLGSDTGGSIRFPSTMNGLTGLKPTWGRVSRAGVLALAESLDHIGPMARSAADCAAVLGVLAGADPDDPTAAPDAVPDYLAALDGPITGLRIGIDRVLMAAGTDADSRAAVEAAAQTLGRLGASIVDVTFPDPGEVVRDWVPLCGVEAAVAHAATYPARKSEYGPVLAGLLDTGLALDGRAVIAMEQRRAAFRGRLEALMATVDALLMPVMNRAAPSLAEMASAGRTPASIEARLRFTAPFDMSGHPTLTLPGGHTAEGMPVGFQITGRLMGEATILRLGYAFQQATDWHRRRPPAFP